MAGLVLKLAPNERVLINGAVMENGERKATLKIKTPNAAILRLRDALHPDDVKTPVTRAYYAAQMVVAGSVEAEQAARDLSPQLDELAEAFGPLPEAETIMRAREFLRLRNFYSLMRTLRPLIEIERHLLNAANALGERATAEQIAPPEQNAGIASELSETA